MNLNARLWAFVAGLVLFLYGMQLLEQALRQLGGRSFHRFLRDKTDTPLEGVVGGTLATMCLQSSSMVGLMVLAFVGAGVLEMRNALGLIFGANLGTTFTGWLVTLLGFKLDLAGLAFPLLALGGLGAIFARSESRQQQIALLIFGLGFLLFGLNLMKGSMDVLVGTFDVAAIQGYHALVYLLAAMLFTALVQSSSAAMIIILSAIDAGAINLPTAAILAIGADLGTTSTVLLGGLRGNRAKRQVALSHFIFNLVVDLLALLLLKVLLYLIVVVFGIKDEMFALVAFHSLFNLLGIALFLPLTNQMVRLLDYLVKDKTGEICRYIHLVPPQVTLAASEAINNESRHLIKKVMWLNLRCFHVDSGELFNTRKRQQFLQEMEGRRLAYAEAYAEIKQMEQRLLDYIHQVQKGAGTSEQTQRVSGFNHAIRGAVVAAKTVKDIRHNMAQLRHASDQWLGQVEHDIRHLIKHLYANLLTALEQQDAMVAEEKLRANEALIDASQARIEQQIYNQNLSLVSDQIEVSSLLNISRAVYLSSTALQSASQDLVTAGAKDPGQREFAGT